VTPTRPTRIAVTPKCLAAMVTPTRTMKTVGANPKRNAATVGATMTNMTRTSLITRIANATLRSTAAQMNAAQQMNAAKVTHGQQILTASHRLVIAGLLAASTNRSLTPTPPTATTASVFPAKISAALYLHIMKHTRLTPTVLSATLAKNAVTVIRSPTTGAAIATIKPNAAFLKATDGLITKSAVAIQDTNAAQMTLSRQTPNTASVIQLRIAAPKTRIRKYAHHA
jgi:hypothetical protein